MTSRLRPRRVIGGPPGAGHDISGDAVMTAPPAPARPPNGRTVNAGPGHAVRRIALGVAAVEAGTVLLVWAGSALAVLPGVLLIVVGVGLTVSGVAGTGSSTSGWVADAPVRQAATRHRTHRGHPLGVGRDRPAGHPHGAMVSTSFPRRTGGQP